MMLKPIVIADVDPAIAALQIPRHMLMLHVFFSYRLLRELELSKFDRTLDSMRDPIFQEEYRDLLSVSQRSSAAFVWWRTYLIAVLDCIDKAMSTTRPSISSLDVRLSFAVVPPYIRRASTDRTDAEFVDYLRDQLPKPAQPDEV